MLQFDEKSISTEYLILIKDNYHTNYIPRCGGAVFEAEKVCVKDVFYHKKCLTCAKCSRALDSLSVSVAPDGDIYCKVRFLLLNKITFNKISYYNILLPNYRSATRL